MKLPNLADKSSKCNIPSITENGKTYETIEEKLEIFTKHLQQAYKIEERPNFDKLQFNKIERWKHKFLERAINTENHEIEEKEYYVINKDKNSTPGHDNITKSIIKKLDPQINTFIIRPYECCLRNNYFPRETRYYNSNSKEHLSIKSQQLYTYHLAVQFRKKLRKNYIKTINLCYR
ncbi:hypothetical protein HHI36_015453 [Cryptolaemus montrouzieri]|uniref:Uncharacterized protein n=1 Tax=Cryptolaemus montrouzieri TaxID=559131 RepID=A0ABD2N649_9CUCU